MTNHFRCLSGLTRGHVALKGVDYGTQKSKRPLKLGEVRGDQVLIESHMGKTKGVVHFIWSPCTLISMKI